ncbi:MAG TPA: hypothetical protein VK943_19435, partial [Arenibaculum sp.]|nr:hypothetical protein [Arenibaculum sp.]
MLVSSSPALTVARFPGTPPAVSSLHQGSSAMGGKYKIVYIAGMPHSGSTLLDLRVSENSSI